LPSLNRRPGDPHRQGVWTQARVQDARAPGNPIQQRQERAASGRAPQLANGRPDGIVEFCAKALRVPAADFGGKGLIAFYGRQHEGSWEPGAGGAKVDLATRNCLHCALESGCDEPVRHMVEFQPIVDQRAHEIEELMRVVGRETPSQFRYLVFECESRELFTNRV
jgi:hypothetical protein